MPVTYSTAAKAARMQAIADLIDAGSSFGRIEIGTSLMGTVLAAIPLAKPCGIVAGAVLTMSGFPKSDTDADAAGTAVAARVVDSDGNVIMSGLSVGVASGDVRIDNLSIALHQTVTLASAVFTHAA